MSSPVAQTEEGVPAPGRVYPVLIVIVALILRLAVLLAISGPQWDAQFFCSGIDLGNLAESLRAGHGLSSPFGGSTGPSAFLAPGYPVLVAATFTVLGPFSHASAIFLKLLQALFGTATVLVLMLVARRFLGERTAIVAGIVWAVCPFALSLPNFFWETSLSILLATSVPALALEARDRHTLPQWLGMGLLAALIFAVNPSLLPIVAGCYGWAFYQARRLPLRAPLLGLLLCLALATPWVVRNAIQLHAFIPLRSNAGYELWQGNRPGADGYFHYQLHPTADRGQFARYASLGEVAYMREKTAQANAAIAADPARFAALTAHRIVSFWTAYGPKPAASEIGYIGATTALGILGLVLLWRRDRSLAMYFLLPLLLFPLPYYITHPDFRFRMILDPMLAMLSAYAVTSWRRPSEPPLNR